VWNGCNCEYEFIRFQFGKSVRAFLSLGELRAMIFVGARQTQFSNRSTSYCCQEEKMENAAVRGMNSKASFCLERNIFRPKMPAAGVKYMYIGTQMFLYLAYMRLTKLLRKRVVCSESGCSRSRHSGWSVVQKNSTADAEKSL
jgi:hypothetical protein